MSAHIGISFHPLWLSLRKRDLVELKVIIANPDDTAKTLTVKVQLPGQLSFDRGGYKTTLMERLEGLNPKTEKVLYYEIYPKPNTQPGEHSIRVTVQEHGRGTLDIRDETASTSYLTVLA